MNKKIKQIENKIKNLYIELKKEKNKYLKSHIKNLMKMSKDIEKFGGDPPIYSDQLKDLLKGNADNVTIRWCLREKIPVIYTTKETGDTYSGHYTYYNNGKLGIYK